MDLVKIMFSSYLQFSMLNVFPQFISNNQYDLKYKNNFYTLINKLQGTANLIFKTAPNVPVSDNRKYSVGSRPHQQTFWFSLMFRKLALSRYGLPDIRFYFRVYKRSCYFLGKTDVPGINKNCCRTSMYMLPNFAKFS